jgi:hypothetical protein
MKKHLPRLDYRRLALRAETLRIISGLKLDQVAGGIQKPTEPNDDCNNHSKLDSDCC